MKTNILLINFLILIPFVVTCQVIKGRVMHQGYPLAEVNILIDGTERGTQSDSKGKFDIEAKLGDVIILSYLGMKTKRIQINNYKTIQVNLVASPNELKEVVVKAKRNNSSKKRSKPKEINSLFGNKKLEGMGSAVSYIDGAEIRNSASLDLVAALTGKTPGFRPTSEGVVLRGSGSIGNATYALWEVDGITYDGFPPPIDIKNVKEVFIVRGLAGTNSYGSRGVGGVIVVKTNLTSGRSNSSKILKNVYLNNQVFSEDAIPYETPTTFKKYGKLGSKEDVGSLVKSVGKDIVALRRLAYEYEESSDIELAIQLYRQVLVLSPTDPHSYRDLANAFLKLGKPTKSWNMYRAYLSESEGDFDDGIGKIMFHEMESLYYKYDLRNELSDSFVPENEFIKTGKGTVRIVFEWVNPNKQINLEVVNPKNLVFQSNLGDETVRPSHISEFFLDDAIKGNWQFNLTINDDFDSDTYLRVTIYDNWNTFIKSSPQIQIFHFEKSDFRKYKLFSIKI